MRVRDPADQAAWAEFDARYREWLIRFFRRRGVKIVDAEDLAQSVLAALVRNLPNFAYDPERGRFRGYLFRCAQNAISAWSACSDRVARPLDLSRVPARVTNGEDDPAAAQVWEEEWVAHHYRRAIETLRQSASERDLAILDRSLGGAEVAALARELQMDEQAVYKARQRIRDRMEMLIAQQVAEEDRTA